MTHVFQPAIAKLHKRFINLKKLLAILLSSILSLQMIPIAHEMERPGGDIDIDKRVENAYTNGNASVGLGVWVEKYYENDPRYTADYILLNVSMLANSRMGIAYDESWESLWWIDDNELTYRNEMVGVGDDWGGWVSFPVEFVAFRFYGGLGSAEYEKVWVCSNGFISFDPWELTSPSPRPGFEGHESPNTVIAAVWTDLNIDGSASIITGLYEFASRRYFVIVWNNALHKASGQRITFQIILRANQLWYEQSQIWVSYASVAAINTDFAYGIEDHEGYKGLGGVVSGDYLGYLNERTIRFHQSSDTFFLKQLTLEFTDTNSNTKYFFSRLSNHTRGNNIKLRSDPPPKPDGNYMFAKSIAGSASLLITIGGVIANVAVWPITLPTSTVLVGLGWADYLAYGQRSNADWLELRDSDTHPSTREAYMKTQTIGDVVDAQLNVIFDWILGTPNNIGSHSLTITAKATYQTYDTEGLYKGEKTLPTSVNIRIGPDYNNYRSTATPIQPGIQYSELLLGGDDNADYYRIQAKKGQTISVYAEAYSRTPQDPALIFSLHLVNYAGIPKKETEPGWLLSLSYVADDYGGFGAWYIEVRIHMGYGFYRFKVDVYGVGVDVKACGGGGGSGS